MYYLVYKVTNKVNNKIYVGVHKTENIDDGYMGSGKILRRAIDKHGIDNFIKEILFEASTAEEMFEKEKEFVEVGKHTYNIKKGGDGGWDYINNSLYANGRDEVWKRNFSLARRGKCCGKDNCNFGKPLPDEVKRKISQHKIGKQYFLGKHHSDETKFKIGLSRRGVESGPNGRCWITKDKINKQTKVGELNNCLTLGWVKGRFFPSGNKPTHRELAS